MTAPSEYLKEIEPDELSNNPDNTLSARKFYARFWSDSLSKELTDNGWQGN